MDAPRVGVLFRVEPSRVELPKPSGLTASAQQAPPFDWLLDCLCPLLVAVTLWAAIVGLFAVTICLDGLLH